MRHPDWKTIPTLDDKFMDMPDFAPWTHSAQLTLLSSPGGQPDCIIGGLVDSATTPQYGLGLESAEITIRIDVWEISSSLFLPQAMTKREGDKGVGYQNVTG
jgi:hypothetical protein